MKSLIVFDLDGTLAPSKSPLDPEAAALVGGLLEVVRVAIISGGDFPQFQKQVIDQLPPGSALRNLSLLPTSGTKFFAYDGSWRPLYSEDLSDEERHEITDALERSIEQSGFKPPKTWGPAIEDRGTQITYSALGQQAPLDEKKSWDPDFAKRKAIQAVLAPMLPKFSVHLGGTTSIDVTRTGVDKAYGIHKLREVLRIEIDRMLFAGDAIFPGGNDYPALTAGTDCILVRDPAETKRVIEAVIACLK